ncbi:PucR family transcriptional regulator [Ornithinimicrobium cavernae]|uniref:PucR family transcriptional regulator n=1 Tax=Ornithinimicrobium cavernae TaxID=2666047 RepID=UPI000D6974C1|nr:helix-turn-helix domain-containing protein [Ornithinimicrobium cavernae]
MTAPPSTTGPGHTAPQRGAITWGELRRTEPLRAVHLPVSAGLDREVHAVRLVSDVEDMRSCRPGTVVVLDTPVATAAWAVPIALRYAWERNVRCVVCQLEPGVAGGVTRLAHRLSVPVGFYDGNLSDLALQLSAIISAPEAARARHLASCAARLAGESTVPAMLTVLEEELPGVRVAVCGSRDGVLVGSLPPAPWSGSVIRVDLSALDHVAGRSLVAVFDHGSVAWAQTVRATMEIARAHVLAAEASDLLDLVRRTEVERWTLHQLISPTPEAGSREGERAGAVPGHLGWDLSGDLVGIVLLTAGEGPPAPGFDIALAAAWDTSRGLSRPVPLEQGWALWDVLPPTTDDLDEEVTREVRERKALRQVAQRVEATLASLDLGVDLVAGLGSVVSDASGLGRTLKQALLAARAARSLPERRVASFTALGARAFVAAADSPDLREVAADTLAPLLADRDGDQLVLTLATYLDCGGSTSRAAARLGVHRNTVTARMERIRGLGLDVDDPDRRLVHHLAAYITGPMKA